MDDRIDKLDLQIRQKKRELARLQAERRKEEPVTRADANAVLDNAIKKIMARDSVPYQTAFLTLQKEKPGLVEGWSAVFRRYMTQRFQAADKAVDYGKK